MRTSVSEGRVNHYIASLCIPTLLTGWTLERCAVNQDHGVFLLAVVAGNVLCLPEGSVLLILAQAHLPA